MLAVTTRNKLRSPRFCVPMLLAQRRIASQLLDTEGLIRYASGIASPTEFLTLTVWESHQSMRSFMQSGAHERLMWFFSQWTASFWAMRWFPTPDEVGSWDGLQLGEAVPAARAMSPLVAVGLLSSHEPRAGPLGPRPESSELHPQAAGVFATTALRLPFGRRATAGRGVMRRSVGIARPWQVLELTLWRDTPEARQAALQAGAAGWAMRWLPGDYEVGHWDRLRLTGRRPSTMDTGLGPLLISGE